MTTTWNQIIGHDWAVKLLSEAIAHRRIGHAYLITGPAQIGKTTLARTFAQALNCEAPAAEQRPCGQCRACTLIAGDRHPDVRLLQPEVSGRGSLSLKIDAIRELQRDLNLAAYEGRYKVAILKRFDAANQNAANAFLKTLEEPPGNVILLLTATDADTLLDTITSRCRTVGLRPLPTALIEESLITRWAVPEERAHLLAHLADGRLGWAVQAAQEPSLLPERSQKMEQLQTILAGNRGVRFAQADRLAAKPELIPPLLQTWLSWWRDLLLLSYGDGQSNGRLAPLTNIDQQATLQQQAQRWPPKAILHSLQETRRALWQLDHNANTRLVLENLFLVYPVET
jgi:DNA polymerase III subunit delta'